MYKPGALKLLTPPCEEQITEGWCDIQTWDEEHGRHAIAGASEPPCAYLPHSCDEWVIGGPEQVRAMIADLQAALLKMETKQ